MYTILDKGDLETSVKGEYESLFAFLIWSRMKRLIKI